MLPVVLCLHGWGGSKDSWNDLRAELTGDDVTVLTPDLPGFGAEPEPPDAWNVDDYAQWVETWVQQHDILRPVILVGHSHGGRTAAAIAARGHIAVRHLVLCAPAMNLRQPTLKRSVGKALARTGRLALSLPGLKRMQPAAKKLLYKAVGAHDYERASPVMKKTLVAVTQQDMRPFLSAIRTPTDILWGESDTMTPIGDATLVQQSIAGSHLQTFPGIKHAVHREKARDVAAAIRKVL